MAILISLNILFKKHITMKKLIFSPDFDNGTPKSRIWEKRSD